MKRLADFKKNIARGWTVQRIAALLIVAGLLFLLGGYANKYCQETCAWLPYAPPLWINNFLGDFYANVSVDCLSVAFAILVIDRLNGRREEEQLKAQLIREMGSTDNGIAIQAVKKLKAYGWLSDGSLHHVNLQSADLEWAPLVNADLREARLIWANLRDAGLFGARLEGARLRGANLQGALLNSAKLQGVQVGFGFSRNNRLYRTTIFSGAHLIKTNLEGAKGFTELHFITMYEMLGTKMPDGCQYNGRFNLYGDIKSARLSQVDQDAPEAIANYYGVSLEEYLAGQEWARENLARVRQEAGLNPDTGWVWKPTNGTEPQLADAPALPAPRRNGHKASMVTHRVR